MILLIFLKKRIHLDLSQFKLNIQDISINKNKYHYISYYCRGMLDFFSRRRGRVVNCSSQLLCIWSYWLLAFRLFLRWLPTANAFPYKATCICFKPTYISVNQIISNYVRNPLIHIIYMHLNFRHWNFHKITRHNLDDIKIVRIVLEMLNMETTYIPVHNLWQ